MNSTKLSREAILAMSTGRELDALVAENVMGWKKGEPQKFPGGIEFDTWHFEKEERPWTHYDWDPSTNLSRAWEVAELFKTIVVKRYFTDNGLWFCEIWDRKTWSLSYGKSAPEAICKAALLAVTGGDTE